MSTKITENGKVHCQIFKFCALIFRKQMRDFAFKPLELKFRHIYLTK